MLIIRRKENQSMNLLILKNPLRKNRNFPPSYKANQPNNAKNPLIKNRTAPTKKPGPSSPKSSKTSSNVQQSTATAYTPTSVTSSKSWTSKWSPRTSHSSTLRQSSRNTSLNRRSQNWGTLLKSVLERSYRSMSNAVRGIRDRWGRRRNIMQHWMPCCPIGWLSGWR